MPFRNMLLTLRRARLHRKLRRLQNVREDLCEELEAMHEAMRWVDKQTACIRSELRRLPQ